MTAHIVQKHPQYAAKLLAKQLEFGDHHSEQPGNTMPKVEEGVKGPFTSNRGEMGGNQKVEINFDGF